MDHGTRGQSSEKIYTYITARVAWIEATLDNSNDNTNNNIDNTQNTSSISPTSSSSIIRPPNPLHTNKPGRLGESRKDSQGQYIQEDIPSTLSGKPQKAIIYFTLLNSFKERGTYCITTSPRAVDMSLYEA